MFLPDNKNSHDIFFFASDKNIVPAPKDLNTLSPERRSTFMNVWTFDYLFSLIGPHSAKLLIPPGSFERAQDFLKWP